MNAAKETRVSNTMQAMAIFVLGAMALINIGRGSIHAFAPDGGAHSIAGLDITAARQTILSLFATLGLQQIVLGLFEAFVLFFRRDLVAIALGLQLFETLAGVANLYAYRTLPLPVPGAPFNAVLAVVLAIAFVFAVRSPRVAGLRACDWCPGPRGGTPPSHAKEFAAHVTSF